jgi:hypothetical protein
MLDKNYLFIFVSLILGVIISLYYIKNFNNKFIILTLSISIIFYIIFYYLGNIKESYQNNFGTNFYNSNFYNSNFYDNIKSEEKILNNNQSEEQNENILYNYHNIIASVKNEVVQTAHIPLQEEQNIIYRKKWYSPEEDINEQPISQETSNILSSVNNITDEEYNILGEEFNMEQTVSKQIVGNGNIPININISYNAQNSTNSNNNNKMSQNENIPSNNNPFNKNLGNIGGVSRVYNNSDWIYGTNAWTNSPDYYIPDKNCNNCDNCPKPLNEIETARKYKENNDVCPLMVNTPWSDFKSGDDIPEPYNV